MDMDMNKDTNRTPDDSRQDKASHNRSKDSDNEDMDMNLNDDSVER